MKRLIAAAAVALFGLGTADISTAATFKASGSGETPSSSEPAAPPAGTPFMFDITFDVAGSDLLGVYSNVSGTLAVDNFGSYALAGANTGYYGSNFGIDRVLLVFAGPQFVVFPEAGVGGFALEFTSQGDAGRPIADVLASAWVSEARIIFSKDNAAFYANTRSLTGTISEVSNVPLPASALLLLGGLAALPLVRRRKTA